MKYRHRVAGLLVLLFAITYIDRVCIPVAGPRIQEDLDIDPVGWGSGAMREGRNQRGCCATPDHYFFVAPSGGSDTGTSRTAFHAPSACFCQTTT